ncbi:MAG: hypothetical protein ACJ8J0_23045 [Longimicrobiaceae bacterium]
MDPVTLIVSSIAAACGPALRDTAQSAVRDAYQAVKALITRKYGSVSLEPVERKPESEAKRTSLAEDLEVAGAGGDEELLALASRLADVVAEHAPGQAAAAGIDIHHVKAEYLRVGHVTAEGTGLSLHDAEFRGGIDVGNVTAGRFAERPKA